ncbi:MAG TPA: hypothetical protein VI542_28545 [Candidatus Tectomicrobia bacterium]
MAPAIATYTPRDPSQTVLYHVIAEHLETFLASLADDPDAKGLPAYVQREFYDYLQCGILAHGFLRLGCDTCHPSRLPVPAKHHVTGSPKPTTTRVDSYATCAPWRPRGGAGVPALAGAKGLLNFLSTRVRPAVLLASPAVRGSPRMVGHVQ